MLDVTKFVCPKCHKGYEVDTDDDKVIGTVEVLAKVPETDGTIEFAMCPTCNVPVAIYYCTSHHDPITYPAWLHDPL